MKFKPTLAFAKSLDKSDPLKKYRDKFIMPQLKEGGAYFCGNSLGLQPAAAPELFGKELRRWAEDAVDGHFTGKQPWAEYHEAYAPLLAEIVGAKAKEVVAMNSLTVNLHLLMATFYQPVKGRTKILTEKGSFSSDRYALRSQIELRGLNPDDHLIEVAPRKGEHTLRKEDILKAIKDCGEELALVMMGGVNYYSGQVFPMKEITAAAHKAGAVCAFDLAHAVGNVPLELHKWNVDFAVWCSYKYLNAGPGAVGGAFIHDRHVKRTDLFRLAGWWGNRKEDRFAMKEEFNPSASVDGWQLSNAPIFNMIALKASLDIFEAAGMKKIQSKRQQMTEWFEFLLKEKCKGKKYSLRLITPSGEKERGAQFSFDAGKKAEQLFQELSKAGFITDLRKPSVIRITPAPLYNSYEETFRLAEFIGERCEWLKGKV